LGAVWLLTWRDSLGNKIVHQKPFTPKKPLETVYAQ